MTSTLPAAIAAVAPRATRLARAMLPRIPSLFIFSPSLRTGDHVDLDEPVRRNQSRDEQRRDGWPDAVEELLAHLDQSLHVLAPHQVEAHLHDVPVRHVRGAQDGSDVRERLPALSMEVGRQLAFRRLADLPGDVQDASPAARLHSVRVDATVRRADGKGIMPNGYGHLGTSERDTRTARLTRQLREPNEPALALRVRDGHYQNPG